MSSLAKRSRAKALAQRLLRDRAERAARKAARTGKSTKIERVEFDPFKPARWRVIAGGDPGHLVKTRMRRGAVGWFITCSVCGSEFESVRLRCCSPKCERKFASNPVLGPPCLGCGQPMFLPRRGRRARLDRLFHSDKCRKRHSRYGGSAPPVLSGILGNKSTKKQSVAGGFFPTEIVGNGYRWPGARRLEPELRRAIVAAEIGSAAEADSPVVEVDGTAEVLLTAKIATADIVTSGDPGPIPDFLRRGVS